VFSETNKNDAVRQAHNIVRKKITTHNKIPPYLTNPKKVFYQRFGCLSNMNQINPTYLLE